MAPRQLTLEFGAGFGAAQVEGSEEHLVYATTRGEQGVAAIYAAPANHETRRHIGVLPGRLLPSRTIAASRARNTVYVAGAAGIWAFPLQGGEPQLVAELPTLPAASQGELEEAYGPRTFDSAWVPHTEGPATYHWLLQVDEEAGRAYALSGQQGAADHLVELNLDAKAITAWSSLRGFAAGIRSDLKRRRVVLPMVDGGPRVVDFEGRHVATCGGEPALGAAIRASDGAIVLSDASCTLWLWDCERDVRTHLCDDGAAPAVSPDGAVFFMRTSAELWVLEQGRPARLVVKAFGNEGGSERDRTQSWLMEPLVSPEGRFVLAQLTSILKTNTAEVAVHDGVVIDRSTGGAQHLPGFFEHTVTWF